MSEVFVTVLFVNFNTDVDHSSLAMAGFGRGCPTGCPGGAPAVLVPGNMSQFQYCMIDNDQTSDITLNDGTLPGWDTVRGGVLLSGGLSQHWDGTSTQSASLLGHLVISRVEILLTLPQSLLQEGRVTSATRPTSYG